MKLFEKLALVQQKIAGVEVQLGVPNRRHLLVRHSTPVGQVANYTDTLILPQPYITTVSPRLVGLPIGNVSVQITDYQVEIPRVYPYSFFVAAKEDKTRISFIIDPPLASISTGTLLGISPGVAFSTSLTGTILAGEIIYSNQITKTITSGIRCTLLHVIDSDPVVWTLILRQDKDGGR